MHARFDEQLLVCAQRPDATAVLEVERWNGTFVQLVNKGAIFNMFVLVGSIKMSDRIIREMMGL